MKQDLRPMGPLAGTLSAGAAIPIAGGGPATLRKDRPARPSDLPEHVRVACPICGRNYNVRPANLGKMARCLCSVKFRLRLKPKGGFSQGRPRSTSPIVIPVGSRPRPLTPPRPLLDEMPALEVPNPETAQAVEAAIEEIIQSSVRAPVAEPHTTVAPQPEAPPVDDLKTESTQAEPPEDAESQTVAESQEDAKPPAAVEAEQTGVSETLATEPGAPAAAEEPAPSQTLSPEEVAAITQPPAGLLARFFGRHDRLPQAESIEDPAAEPPPAADAPAEVTPLADEMAAATEALTQRESQLCVNAETGAAGSDSPSLAPPDEEPATPTAQEQQQAHTPALEEQEHPPAMPEACPPLLDNPPAAPTDDHTTSTDPEMEAIPFLVHAQEPELAVPVHRTYADEMLPIPFAAASTGLIHEENPPVEEEDEPEAFDDFPLLLHVAHSPLPVGVEHTAADEMLPTPLHEATTGVITESTPPEEEEEEEEAECDLADYMPILLHGQAPEPATELTHTSATEMLPIRIAEACTTLVTLDNPPQPEPAETFDDIPLLLHAEQSAFAVGVEATSAAEMLPSPLSEACSGPISEANPPRQEPPESFDAAPLLLHAEQSDFAVAVESTSVAEMLPTPFGEGCIELIAETRPPREEPPPAVDCRPVLLCTEQSDLASAVQSTSADKMLPVIVPQASTGLITQANPPEEEEPETFDDTPLLIHCEQSDLALAVATTSADEALPAAFAPGCSVLITQDSPPEEEEPETFDDTPLLLMSAETEPTPLLGSTSAADMSPAWLTEPQDRPITQDNPPPPEPVVQVDLQPVLLFAAGIAAATAVDYAAPEPAQSFPAASSEWVTELNPPEEEEPEPVDQTPLLLFAAEPALATAVASLADDAGFELVIEPMREPISQDNLPPQEPEPVIDDSPVLVFSCEMEPAVAIDFTSSADMLPEMIGDPMREPVCEGQVPVDTTLEGQLARILRPLPRPLAGTLLRLVSDVIAANAMTVAAAPGLATVRPNAEPTAATTKHVPAPTPRDDIRQIEQEAKELLGSVFDEEFLPTLENDPPPAAPVKPGRYAHAIPELPKPANTKPRLHVAPAKRQLAKPSPLPSVAPRVDVSQQRKQTLAILVAVAIAAALGGWAAYHLVSPAELTGAWEEPRSINPLAEESYNLRLVLDVDQSYELASRGQLAPTRGQWSQQPQASGSIITLHDAADESAKWAFDKGALTQMDAISPVVLKKHLLRSDYLACTTLALLGLLLAYAIRCYVRERLILFGRNY